MQQVMSSIVVINSGTLITGQQQQGVRCLDSETQPSSEQSAETVNETNNPNNNRNSQHIRDGIHQQVPCARLVEWANNGSDSISKRIYHFDCFKRDYTQEIQGVRIMNLKASMKPVYESLLKIINDNQDGLKYDYNVNIKSQLENRIKQCEIAEDFKIDLPFSHSTNWIEISSERVIGYIDGETSTIGCSDNGEQPSGEHLYIIRFPCGAYTLNDRSGEIDKYPCETFNKMFNELKSFGPKYCDTPNNSLYFTSENAHLVHNAYIGIFKKYKGMVDDELKKQHLEKLKKEVEKLESESCEPGADND